MSELGGADGVPVPVRGLAILSVLSAAITWAGAPPALGARWSAHLTTFDGDVLFTSAPVIGPGGEWIATRDRGAHVVVGRRGRGTRLRAVRRFAALTSTQLRRAWTPLAPSVDVNSGGLVVVGWSATHEDDSGPDSEGVEPPLDNTLLAYRARGGARHIPVPDGSAMNGFAVNNRGTVLVLVGTGAETTAITFRGRRRLDRRRFPGDVASVAEGSDAINGASVLQRTRHQGFAFSLEVDGDNEARFWGVRVSALGRIARRHSMARLRGYVNEARAIPGVARPGVLWADFPGHLRWGRGALGRNQLVGRLYGRWYNAVNAAGREAVIWEDWATQGFRLAIARNGRRFGQPIRLPARTPPTDSAVAVDALGRTTVVWRDSGYIRAAVVYHGRMQRWTLAGRKGHADCQLPDVTARGRTVIATWTCGDRRELSQLLR